MAFDIAAIDELIDMVQNRVIVQSDPVYYGPRDFLGRPLRPDVEALIRQDQRQRLAAVEALIRQDQRQRLAAVEGLTVEEIEAAVAAHRAAVGEG